MPNAIDEYFDIFIIYLPWSCQNCYDVLHSSHVIITLQCALRSRHF